MHRTGTALCLGVALSVGAQEPPPPAYQDAARLVGIPPPVLYAVALQESGLQRSRRLVPWPWTLNVAGIPYRYANRIDACQALLHALRHTAAKRVDAGLAQINVGYQAHRYVHPCDVLDPYRNLAMAAEILREHYTPAEGWLLAIGRYHRPAGGPPAARYRRSVQRHLTRVLGPAALPLIDEKPTP